MTRILAVLWRIKHGASSWDWDHLTSGEQTEFRQQVGPVDKVIGWWGSNCGACGGNATHGSSTCDNCGNTDTNPLFEVVLP